MPTNKKDRLKKVLKEKNINHDSKNIHDALKKHKQTKKSDEVLKATPKRTSSKIPMLDIILYSLIPLIIVAIGFIAYLFTSQKEQNVQFVETEVKKVEPVKQKELIFSNLPNDIQKQYILKTKYDKDIKSKDQKQKVQEEQNLTVYNSLNKSDIVFRNSSTAKDVLKCYDMNSLKSDLSQNCQKSLKQFIQKYKDVKYYEIVGIVSLNEIPKDDIKDIQKYQNLILGGLAQKRANEIAWFMRKIIGQKPIIRVINYPVLSKKNNKGAIVRIYD